MSASTVRPWMEYRKETYYSPPEAHDLESITRPQYGEFNQLPWEVFAIIPHIISNNAQDNRFYVYLQREERLPTAEEDSDWR